MTMNPNRNNRGFALVLTLVVTTLMVVVVSELIHQVYVDVSLSRGFRDCQQASLLAESGVTGGMKILQLSLQNRDYTALTDPWAQPNKLDDEAGAIEVKIMDESGKINLNNLVQPNGELEPNLLQMLKRLGASQKIPEEVWNALADWIDKDDLPRSNGAESPYYRSLKPPYASRDTTLTTVSELSLVRGMTPDMVTRLQPFVTVHAAQAGAPVSLVNINTAPKEVLMALDEGIDERMAERILEERRLQAFKSPGELSRISGAEAISQKLVGKVNVKGSLFRIHSLARVKESTRSVEAVVRMIGGGVSEIVSWQEY